MIGAPRMARHRRFMEACAAARAALQEAKALGLKGQAFLDFVSKKGLSNLACALLVKAKLQAGEGPASSARFVAACEAWGLGDVVSVLVTKCSVQSGGSSALFYKLAMEADLGNLASVMVTGCSLEAEGDMELFHALAVEAGLGNLASVMVTGCALEAGEDSALFYKLAVKAGLGNLASVMVTGCALEAGEDSALFYKLAVEAGLGNLASVLVTGCSLEAGGNRALFVKLARAAGLDNLVSVVTANARLMANGDMALYIKNVEGRGIIGNMSVEKAKRRLLNNSNRLFLLCDPTIVSQSLLKSFLMRRQDMILSRDMLLAAVPSSTFKKTITTLGFSTSTTSFHLWERGISMTRGHKKLDLRQDASVNLTKGRFDVLVAKRCIVMEKPRDPNNYCFTLLMFEGRSPASSSSSSSAAAERPLTLGERVSKLEPRYNTPTDMPSAYIAPVPYSPPP
jgi:hypothetical protein